MVLRVVALVATLVILVLPRAAYAEAGIPDVGLRPACECNADCGAGEVCVLSPFQGSLVCCPASGGFACPVNPGPGVEVCRDAGLRDVPADERGFSFDTGSIPQPPEVGAVKMDTGVNRSPDAADAGAASAPGGPLETTEEGGCACRARGARGAPWGLMALAVLSALLVARGR